MCGHLPKTKLTLSKLQQILFRLRLSETLPYYGQGKSQACFTKYGSTIKFKDDKWAGPTGTSGFAGSQGGEVKDLTHFGT